MYQDEEAQIMRGLAWSTVSELEPKMQRLEQQIEQALPSKLKKIEACLAPAQQKVEEMQRHQEGQVCGAPVHVQCRITMPALDLECCAHPTQLACAVSLFRDTAFLTTSVLPICFFIDYIQCGSSVAEDTAHVTSNPCTCLSLLSSMCI